MENTDNFTITNFVPIEKIGEGSFSSVYKVKRKADNKIYALKKIKIAALKDKQKKNALNEIRILASVTSPFIVQYRQAFFDHNLNLLCIVMELANDGDLQKKIEFCRNNYSRFPESQIWKMIYQTVKGLDTLHSNLIMHRDIKSANIFISDGMYKLGDLNVSKIFNPEDVLARTQTGTPYYASPEVWRDQPYDSKSDIWSLGCVIYEMCALKPPFKAKQLQDLYQKVQKGKYEEIPALYSKDLRQFIKLCLKKKPYERPTCLELINKILIKKCQEYKIDFLDDQPNADLLRTIKLPNNLKQLQQTLPKAAYQPQSLIQTEEKFGGFIKKPKICDRRIISSQQKNKLYRYLDVSQRSHSKEHSLHLKFNPQLDCSEQTGSKLFFNEPSHQQFLQKEVIELKMKNRNYISEDQLKKLSHLADTKKIKPQIDIKNRKLSQDDKNAVESQKRRKNILGGISIIRKMSENGANMKKQYSQRYYNVGNSLKNVVKKVGSTDRISSKNSQIMKKQANKTKRGAEKEVEGMKSNPNKQIRKIGSNSRLKNPYLGINKNRNANYHRPDVLHKNLKESADQISHLLQKQQSRAQNEEQHNTKAVSPQSKQKLSLHKHRRLNKIISTPYLSGVIGSKKQISVIKNTSQHEIGLKKMNKLDPYHKITTKVNKNLHLS